MFRSLRLPLGAALLATTLTACESSPTPPSDPTPTPAPTTETFSGSVSPNGAVTFPFTVASAGTVTASLTTVQPDATVALGLSLGTWNGTLCQIVLANDNALVGTVVTGAVSSLDSLCVRVYDTGKVTGTMTYTVTVVHP
jgi:hypothetical protein